MGNPVVAFQIFIVLSPLPLAILLPFGLHATEFTLLVCPPVRVIRGSPVVEFHIFISPLSLPVANFVPSLFQVSELTDPTFCVRDTGDAIVVWVWIP